MKKVKILAISKKDAFYNKRKEFIGKIVDFERIGKSHSGSFVYGFFIYNNTESCFYRVKVKEIKNAKRK